MIVVSTAHILLCLFIVVVACLLFYYVYFFSRLAYYKAPVRKELVQHPVTVVVCGKDEADNFARNIPGLIFQEYDGSRQIIIVNDRSTDGSKTVLEALNHQYHALEIIHLNQESKDLPGKKYPLSTGIRHAAHEILLLTDADCVPATEFWMERMQSAYTDGIDIVLGYGAYQKLPGLLNKIIRYETFLTAMQYLSYALAGMPYMGVGRNLSYKKSLYNSVNGFHSISFLPGGDDDLFINKIANKNNVAIMIDAAAHTISTPKKTWKEWVRQKTRHYSVSKYYKFKHQALLGFYSLLNILFYILAIICLFTNIWIYTLCFLVIKNILQQIIFSKVLHKLNESDLSKWIILMDLWMIFYYFIYIPSLFKKTNNKWK